MKPEVYYNYLLENKWVPGKQLNENWLISFMPEGIDKVIWDQSRTEKFFLGRVRHLSNNIEFLSSFGIGAGAARTHLALAIEAGAKNIIVVGTVGALNPELKIGDIVCLEGGAPLFAAGIREVSTQSLMDIFEKPRGDTDVVDMEWESLSAWCQNQSVSIAGLAVVSDLIHGDNWTPGFEQIKNSMAKAHKMAFELLSRRPE